MDIKQRIKEFEEEKRREILKKPIVTNVKKVAIWYSEDGDVVGYEFYDKNNNKIHEIVVEKLMPYHHVYAVFKNVEKVEQRDSSPTITFEGIVGCEIKEDKEYDLFPVLKLSCNKEVE